MVCSIPGCLTMLLSPGIEGLRVRPAGGLLGSVGEWRLEIAGDLRAGKGTGRGDEEQECELERG